MDPVLGVVLCWLLFGGMHIGLATGRLRAGLVARLGEWGFNGLFSLVAAATFTLLVRYYTGHRFDGPAGLAAGQVTALRWVLMAVIVSGIVLTIASLVAYPGSPTALFTTTIRAPRGVERVTRHGFFAGVALLGLAHALLATRLVGTVFFAALALFASVGAWHQDRKLLRRHGAAYADYLAATSVIPFGAVVSGRQRVVWRELAGGALVAGVLVAIVLRTLHATILAHGGAWVVGAVVAGGAVETVQSWRRAHRRRVPAALAPRAT